MQEVCLTCIWFSCIHPLFPTWKSTCAYLRSLRFPGVQAGRWPPPACLRTWGLRLIASGDAQTTCTSESWWLWLRHDPSSLFYTLCNVHELTHLSPWGFPGRWGQPTPTSPEMAPVLLYHPSLGKSRLSWTHSSYSFHFYSKCTHL